MYWIKDNEVYRGPAMGRTWMESHGWTASETPPPVPEEPPAPRVLSKLKLRDKLVELGLWDQVKTALESSGELERWNLAHDVAEDDPGVAAVLTLLGQAEKLNALFEECIMERY